MSERKLNTILVIDDEPQNISLLSNALSLEYKIAAATSAESALKYLFENALPSLILLDVLMPETDGYQLCKQLKDLPKFANIPIIFVTAKSQITDQANGFSLGAVDYITKPIHPGIVLSRVKVHIDIHNKEQILRDSIQSLKSKEQESELIKSELTTLALTDSLTDLPNRRYFYKIAQNEFTRFQREQQVFSILMIDIDHFKKVNDNYGHSAGDKVLQSFGQLAKTLVRQHECVARYGGEEFISMLPNTDEEGAKLVAHRVLNAVREHALEIDGKRINLTVSIGYSSITPKDKSLDDVISRADFAVYRAKENGRNKVCDYQ